MRRKILLIDDDRLQFRVTQGHFASFAGEAYELEWAATYEDGLDRLLGGTFAACLLDYQLGERDGLQLIREAVARGSRTPIVFLTAETAQQVDIEAMNAGALDYLVKGEITPRMLERSIRYALKLGDTLDQLHRLATRDELTGLINRREFDRMLAEEQERTLRFGHPLALAMMDVDRFKAVNDTHGHRAGDEVLREISRRLAVQVRNVDRVARFGGDEFALLLVQTEKSTAMDVLRRVCAAIKSAPIITDGGVAIDAALSVGIAAMPEDARGADALVAAADKALYAAKTGGRDRAVAFGGS
jgi:diguanylate cyclase (GGDEF)-like protein